MRGYFGIGIENTKDIFNIGTLWRSADLFGAAFIFTIGRRYKKQASDTSKALRRIPLYNYVDFDDFYRHMPANCHLAGIELTDSAIDLDKFNHTQRCIYLLGAEDHGLSNEALKKCHSIIKIPIGDFSMNVSTAGSIVLYDRWVKNNYILNAV